MAELDWTYEGALRLAGATVLASKHFGSYQGDWWALVEYRGRRGWARGSYGSCSGCDRLQFLEMDFGWTEAADGDDQRNADGPAGEKALREEGERMLAADLLTDEEALAEAGENLDWDLEANEMVDFITANKASAGNEQPPGAR